MKTSYRKHLSRNSGSALIIALVILMVMTLIGLTSMNTSILEERMAGSMFNRNLGFQAAESALREGEGWIASQSVLPDVSNDGSSGIWDIRAADPDTSNNLGWWDESTRGATWWGSSAVPIATSSSDAEWIAGVFAQPAYVIEELPPIAESLEVGKSVDDNDIYLQVTARGVGGTASSVVLLQSTYKW